MIQSRLTMPAWIGFALLLAQAATAMAAAPAAERPNVLIVLTDDQGYGDFSCHGNPILKTPNLDKLHDQSIRFTDFHVCPMCTPTRSQIMTGRDCLTTGAYVVCSGHDLLREGIPTMAERLCRRHVRRRRLSHRASSASGTWAATIPFARRIAASRSRFASAASASSPRPTIGITTATTTGISTTASSSTTRAIAPTSGSAKRCAG